MNEKIDGRVEVFSIFANQTTEMMLTPLLAREQECHFGKLRVILHSYYFSQKLLNSCVPFSLKYLFSLF